MKISEMIMHLERLKEEHGDLECYKNCEGIDEWYTSETRYPPTLEYSNKSTIDDWGDERVRFISEQEYNDDDLFEERCCDMDKKDFEKVVLI